MGQEAILVVGGAGYIGTHMVKALLENGFHVITLDNLSTGHRDLIPGGEFIQGDLSDVQLLDRLFTERSIAAVMHFAAFSLVGQSVEDPIPYYQNNLAGTISLLSTMIRHHVKRFIFSSTAAVYGEPSQVPIHEMHPCLPTNPYGATKLAVERFLSDCDHAYGLRYISLRYFNASGADITAKLGERHVPETHLIPLIMKVALKELPQIRLFGTQYDTPDGTCIRDYVHVTDLAAAHLLALRSLIEGGTSATYNLGNSKGYSVREVIDLSRKVTGVDIPVEEVENRPGDPAVLVADSQQIRQELGWRPEYEHLEAIIETAWKWHQKDGPSPEISPF